MLLKRAESMVVRWQSTYCSNTIVPLPTSKAASRPALADRLVWE